MENLSKVCEDCKAPLKGRSDKRFCNDYCRNSFHTKQNRDWNNYMRNINYILRKNRRILESLYAYDKGIVSREQLSLNGFKFQYCTYMESENELRKYYDFSLTKIDQDKYRINRLESERLLQTG